METAVNQQAKLVPNNGVHENRNPREKDKRNGEVRPYGYHPQRN